MPIPKVNIEKVNKMPLAYALMIVGGLLGVFATNYFNKDKEVIAAYKLQHERDTAEKALLKSNCETNTNFWRDKFLNLTNYNTEVLRKQDSINRVVLQKPNKELQRAIEIKKRNE